MTFEENTLMEMINDQLTINDNLTASMSLII